jgi:hypothetical protein
VPRAHRVERLCGKERSHEGLHSRARVQLEDQRASRRRVVELIAVDQPRDSEQSRKLGELRVVTR